MVLSACGPSQFGDYGYDDFPWIEHWDDLLVTGFKEGHTLVYHYNRDFFGNDCPGCVVINETLFAFGQHNTEGIALKVINERTAQGNRPAAFRTQPQVFFVREGVITYRVVGAGPILAMLEEIETETFDWSLLE